MKKRILGILLLCLVLSSFADFVDLQDAEIVARNFLRSYDISTEIDFNSNIVSHSEDILAYVFTLTDGFIVITANTDLPPVLAYSTTAITDIENNDIVPVAFMKSDLEMRLQAISDLPGTMLESRNEKWNDLLHGVVTEVLTDYYPPEGTTTTGGWLQFTWNQTAPYNSMCPMDRVNMSRSLAGCPSIAMAEIMNFLQTTNGTRLNDDDDYTHSYAGRTYRIDDDYETIDFPSFPELNDYIESIEVCYESCTEISSDERAALIFACGIACEQVYSSDGSGTFGVDQAYDAYQRFGFEECELIMGTALVDFTRINENIMDGMPVHYAVVTPAWDAGHNLVIDGYNSDGYHHLNFGWGGMYDGWYSLPDEVPYSLTVIEGVVLDIMPEESKVAEIKPETSELYVYPNPFNGRVQISSEDAKGIEIFDIFGNKVFSSSENNITWNPENASSGLYLVRVITESGKEEIKRISYIK